MLHVDERLHHLVGKRFFYGWAIVAVNFVSSMITGGISAYGLSLFLIPMAHDLGVSRGAISSVTLFRLLPVVVVPFLGVLADKKHGPRVLMTVGSLIAGLSLVSLAGVQSLWHFYVGYGVVFGLAMMTFGGQLVGPAVLSKWFIRKRGRAIAIGTMGISAGGLVIAPFAGWIISAFGWRVAWAALGVGLILLVTPASALFMRRRPEDIGLLPDGNVAVPVGGSSKLEWVDTEHPWTVRAAAKTSAFWLLMAVQILGMGALIPVLIHQVAYVTDKGFSIGTATTVATALAFFSIIAKLPWGYLSERLSMRWVVALCLIPTGFALLLLIGAQTLWQLYFYAAVYGLTMGGWPTLSNLVWASYFGRQHAGAIRGVVTPVGSVVSAASPVLAGVMWDRLGSYTVPFLLFSAAWVLAGLLMLVTRQPKPPEPAVNVLQVT